MHQEVASQRIAVSAQRLEVLSPRRTVTSQRDQRRGHRALVHGFGAANRCLTSRVTAHDVMVSRYDDGITGLAFLVTRFDRAIHCFGAQVRPQRLEVT